MNMNSVHDSENNRQLRYRLDRRQLLAYAVFGATVLTGATASASAMPANDIIAAPGRYNMKNSINLGAFPYPGKMTLGQCLPLATDAGFDVMLAI